MASGPEGTELANYKRWVLKVSIHCEGCEKKMKRILHKVKGVYAIDVDAKQNRVTVTGNVDAESLIQKLLKYGKHAELLPEKNPPVSDLAKTEAKGKEKAVPAAPKPAATAAAETEEKKQAEKGEAVEIPPASAAVSDEVTASKPDTEATADTDSKKKGNEKEVSGTINVTGTNSPPANLTFPANFHPLHATLSYHTANPSTSYAYYEAPPPEMPSSYAYYGNPPPAEYSPEHHYSPESYYGSIDQPSQSAGSYDMFNDENPNACKLM